MQKQQPNRKVLLFLAALAVLAGIVWGALFLIAPIWQPGTPVAYMPALPQTEAAVESVPTQLVDLNTADAETLQTLPAIGPAKAAAVIAQQIDRNVGLIAFPWPVRFAAWFMSVLPNRISEFIYNRLPHKV